jgi:hypothetical protein
VVVDAADQAQDQVGLQMALAQEIASRSAPLRERDLLSTVAILVDLESGKGDPVAGQGVR